MKLHMAVPTEYARSVIDNGFVDTRQTYEDTLANEYRDPLKVFDSDDGEEVRPRSRWQVTACDRSVTAQVETPSRERCDLHVCRASGETRTPTSFETGT